MAFNLCLGIKHCPPGLLRNHDAKLSTHAASDEFEARSGESAFEQNSLNLQFKFIIYIVYTIIYGVLLVAPFDKNARKIAPTPPKRKKATDHSHKMLIKQKPNYRQISSDNGPKQKQVHTQIKLKLKTHTETMEDRKRPQLIRDSFTMPEAEYQVLSEVKKACLTAGFTVKKSELLRVGVALIQVLDIADLRKIVNGLAPLKVGRPKKEI